MAIAIRLTAPNRLATATCLIAARAMAFAARRVMTAVATKASYSADRNRGTFQVVRAAAVLGRAGAEAGADRPISGQIVR